MYQDALSSFDPRWSVHSILDDAVRTALPGSGRREREPRIADLLDQVGLAGSVAGRRPLTLSGGQRQRVAIARALAAAPSVLVCDEPVSALDVTIQAQILDLLDDLQRQEGLALLFISHDLGVVRHMSDRVAVMRTGRIVEAGGAADVFAAPRHPYTAQLVADARRSLIETDPPAHSRLRRIVSSAFTPRKVRDYERYTREIAGSLLDPPGHRGGLVR